MSYMLRADDIVGYTFEAELLCPRCVVKRVTDEETAELGSTEMVLNFVAEKIGLDRENEYGFDSDDFPKVVFGNQADSDETCDGCGEVLF